MHKLTQFRLCPQSRAVRLVLGEYGVECELADERPWEWRASFLALNPAGELPVLELEASAILCGAYAIVEYVAEEIKAGTKDERRIVLFPGDREERAEVRRLVDWFHRKLDREVTREILAEKVYPVLGQGDGRVPDPAVMRAVRSNFRYHLGYLSYLADHRRWLAGEELSYTDLAAAAHLSVLDYLDEVPWESYPIVRSWYQRVKSRRSFRPLLADRLAGLAPPAHYPDIDF